RRLFPRIFPDGLRADLGAVDVPGGIHGNAFCRAGPGIILVRLGIRNERVHKSVDGAADPDAAFPSLIPARVGFGIGRVEDVVGVDEEPAGTAELRPGCKMLAFLVEDLDAAVATIANEQSPRGIHCEGMRIDKLTVGLSCRSPFFYVGSVGREFDDAVVAALVVTVGYENVTVRRNKHCGGSVERILAVACDSLLAERHQQFAVLAELVDHVSPAFGHRCVSDGVGYPYVALGIDENSVWPRDESSAKAPDYAAGLVE